MYIDFAAAFTLIICIIRGEKKGVFRTFLSAFGWLFALFFSLLYSPRVADIIDEKTNMKSMVSDLMVRHLKSMVTGGTTTSTSSTDLPGLVARTIASSSDSAIEAAVRPTADILADTLITILAFLITVFVIKFLVRFIERLAARLRSIKPIGTADGILGMLFGIVKGGVLIYILICIAILVAAATSYEPLTEVLQSSVCVQTLQSHDLIFFGEDIINGVTLPQIEN